MIFFSALDFLTCFAILRDSEKFEEIVCRCLFGYYFNIIIPMLSHFKYECTVVRLFTVYSENAMTSSKLLPDKNFSSFHQHRQ